METQMVAWVLFTYFYMDKQATWNSSCSKEVNPVTRKLTFWWIVFVIFEFLPYTSIAFSMKIRSLRMSFYVTSEF